MKLRGGRRSHRLADRAARVPDIGAHGERGQALVELALVVTIVLVMAGAVFDLGLGFFNATLTVHGARDGARAAMDCGNSVADIQAAALAAAPAGATAAVSPNPRPTCPPSNSSDSTTTVTVTYTHTWITPIWELVGWGSGGTLTMSESATSR